MSKLIYKLSKDGKSYKVTGMEKIPYEVEYDAFDGKKHTRQSYRFDIDDTLEIPQIHNGLPVIEITKDAFANDVFTISGKIFKSHNIKKVILPDGFKIIGKYAFINCVNLKEIIIPNSVAKVDKGAFIGCYNLKAIKFSEKMKEIPEQTCNGCNSLKEISIPSSIKSIGQYAFNGMTGVPNAHKFRAESTYVAIPSSVIKIGQRAFGNYKNLTIDVYGHETKPDGWDEEWCYGTKYSNIDGVVKVNWNT